MSHGAGGVWNQQVYANRISPIIGFRLKIVDLEILNVVVALRLWARDWTHSAVKFLCDNLSVVQVVQTGKTKDTFLAACMRNICLILAIYDIDLAGSKNQIADFLSHVHSEKPFGVLLA